VCRLTPVVGARESERVGCPEALDTTPTHNEGMVLIEVALDKLSDPLYVEAGPKCHVVSQISAAPGDDHDLSRLLVGCTTEPFRPRHSSLTGEQVWTVWMQDVQCGDGWRCCTH
jgi:hypothetical protein